MGVYQLAAARLAINIFNSRNGSAFPALASLDDNDHYYNCNTTIGKLKVLDTASRWDTTVLDNVDAIVGPYNEVPALELSAAASALKIPIVSHLSSFDNHHNLQPVLSNSVKYPFWTQISPIEATELQFVARYLLHIQRTRYIAIMAPNTPSAMRQVGKLWKILDQQDDFDQVRTFSYHATTTASPLEQETCGPLPEYSIRDTLEQIYRTGYRTIILLGVEAGHVMELGTAASEYGLDIGQHFWVLSLSSPNLMTNPAVFGNGTTPHPPSFLFGSAFLTPDEWELPILDWGVQHDTTSVSEVLGRIQNDIYLQHQNLTSTKLPAVQQGATAPGTGFLVDAIMSIGMGACHLKAESSNQSTTIASGIELRDRVRSLGFRGASGQVLVGEDGQRADGTVPFSVLTFIASNNSGGFLARQAESWDPTTGEWKQIYSLRYADGTKSPPFELRTQPNQNYISTGARVIGMALFFVSLTTVVASTIWVFVNRENSVVIASQPVFLYTLCFASGLSSFTILFAAFDESWGLDEGSLTTMCFAWTWFDAMATTIIYSALFTKLWRANRCLRYKTNNIALWRVMWPFGLFLLAVISIMIAMTCYSDYGWKRVEDDVSGESQGYCDGESLYVFLAPVHTIHMIPVCLSALMAFRTKDFGTANAESKWVLALILVQTQFMLAALPTIYLLAEISPTAKYLGLAAFWFTIPTTCMGLIILPQAIKVHQMKRLAREPQFQSTETVPVSVEPAPGDEENDELQANNILRSSSGDQSPGFRGPRIQMVTFD